jgi:hypothetical protein
VLRKTAHWAHDLRASGLWLPPSVHLHSLIDSFLPPKRKAFFPRVPISLSFFFKTM